MRSPPRESEGGSEAQNPLNSLVKWTRPAAAPQNPLKSNAKSTSRKRRRKRSSKPFEFLGKMDAARRRASRRFTGDTLRQSWGFQGNGILLFGDIRTPIYPCSKHWKSSSEVHAVEQYYFRSAHLLLQRGLRPAMQRGNTWAIVVDAKGRTQWVGDFAFPICPCSKHWKSSSEVHAVEHRYFRSAHLFPQRGLRPVIQRGNASAIAVRAKGNTRWFGGNAFPICPCSKHWKS